ncbi:abortive phage resistance protein [Klebsiella pneumoniae]|nr:abortive phage resistance protein [Klebsiella pneumoniae]
MNNSPVLNLQEMASSSSVDIETLLSRAKMISVKLGLQDISDWLDYEMKGYPSHDLLPEYRIILDAPVMAFNPYSGWVPYQIANTTGKYQEVYDSLTTININNPISMLVEHAKSESVLHSDLPGFMRDLLQEMAGCRYRMAWCIYPAQLINIISSVRVKILDWSLLLESKGILGEGLLFSKEEKKEAYGMTINNVNNFNASVNNSGAIGAGNTGDIAQANLVNNCDFESLSQKLKGLGVAIDDVAELKKLIVSTSHPKLSGNFDPVIANWMGSVMGKAYSGELKVSGAEASVLIVKALSSYYGS